MTMKKKYLLVLITAILIIVFTPAFGGLYDEFFGPITSWFWGPSHPEYVEGFFVSYMFFVSLFVTVFAGDNKNRYLLKLLGIVLLLDFFSNAWEGLIIDAGVAVIGYLLAQGILMVKKRMARK